MSFIINLFRSGLSARILVLAVFSVLLLPETLYANSMIGTANPYAALAIIALIAVVVIILTIGLLIRLKKVDRQKVELLQQHGFEVGIPRRVLMVLCDCIGAVFLLLAVNNFLFFAKAVFLKCWPVFKLHGFQALNLVSLPKYELGYSGLMMLGMFIFLDFMPHLIFVLGQDLDNPLRALLIKEKVMLAGKLVIRFQIFCLAVYAIFTALSAVRVATGF